MQYPEGRILIFCKAPEPGKVKTRLQGALSPAQCAQLHERLAQHTLQTAIDSGIAGVELWCAGDSEHPFFKECVQRYDIEARRQQGPDLGARMAHALRSALRSSTFAIIIGTDCPGLGARHLQSAAEFLGETGRLRAVIGPATDGGYVLFGANSGLPGAFENIEWGSARVLQQTRDRLRDLKVACKELEALNDIDRPEDLKHLPEFLA